MADDKAKNDQQELETEDVEETKGGADQSTEAKAGEDNGGAGGNDAGAKQEKTFTQDQVNRMMAREKNQGRAAALKELGIDPKDAKAVAMVKALVESQKTDEQKAAEKAAEDSAKQSENERRVMVAEAKAEAMMLGVQAQYVDDVIALALAKMSDDTDLKTIIGEYKNKYPMWFKAEEEDGGKGGNGSGKKTGQKGTGSSVKSNAGGKESETKGLGARLAAQRKSATKSSYWGGKR